MDVNVEGRGRRQLRRGVVYNENSVTRFCPGRALCGKKGAVNAFYSKRRSVVVMKMITKAVSALCVEGKGGKGGKRSDKVCGGNCFFCAW